mmetsp:Transcript_43295/g.117270  ORF Transcript_43295/g.117270 Transcript_43295/m.117270 type:complete len:131 (-) Transcript_43295:292-684(-)
MGPQPTHEIVQEVSEQLWPHVWIWAWAWGWTGHESVHGRRHGRGRGHDVGVGLGRTVEAFVSADCHHEYCFSYALTTVSSWALALLSGAGMPSTSHAKASSSGVSKPRIEMLDSILLAPRISPFLAPGAS